MLKPIVYWPSPILKQVSNPVETAMNVDVLKAKELMGNLFDTMYKHRGIGLSAIQIGINQRMFVMDSRNIWKKIYAFVNPEIVELIDTPVPYVEGCLSVPGYSETKLRHPQLILKALDLVSGRYGLWDCYELEAQCVQHEMEHLDGKLFIDGAGKVKRDIIKKKMQKFNY